MAQNQQQNQGKQNKPKGGVHIIVNEIKTGVFAAHAYLERDGFPIANREVMWHMDGALLPGSSKTDADGKTPPREFKFGANTVQVRLKVEAAGVGDTERLIDTSKYTPEKPAGKLKIVAEPIVPIGPGEIRTRLSLTNPDTQLNGTGDVFISFPVQWAISVEGNPKIQVPPTRSHKISIPKSGVECILQVFDRGRHQMDATIDGRSLEDADVYVRGPEPGPVQANKNSGVLATLLKGCYR